MREQLWRYLLLDLWNQAPTPASGGTAVSAQPAEVADLPPGRGNGAQTELKSILTADRRNLMNRTAHCCCGSLRTEALAEPIVVAACHCTECQRRTGGPFLVGAFFAKEHVRTEGPSKIY